MNFESSIPQLRIKFDYQNKKHQNLLIIAKNKQINLFLPGIVKILKRNRSQSERGMMSKLVEI